MSRIQDILNKAERDGTVRRTRGLGTTATAVAEPLRHRRSPCPGRDADDAPRGRAVRRPPHVASRSRRDAERDGTLDQRLVAALAPQSLAAEQYRSLRTRIKRAENGRAVRAIVVTSPNKGDGKSLTAANLALTMAQEFQQRVLLIDADLRRPSLHRLFGIAETPGLTDVLMGGATLDDALVDAAPSTT